MTPEQFVYWLQGYFEIARPHSITPQEVFIIKDHLQLVFHKATPDYPAFSVARGEGANLGSFPNVGFTCSLSPNSNSGTAKVPVVTGFTLNSK
jgi:hypothetical protein